MRNVSPSDSLKLLEGKTIKLVKAHSVNSVTIVTECGQKFEIETEAVIPSMSIYGMNCTQKKTRKK